MGCWNETCAVTHATIRCGDRVTMIVVTDEASRCEWWRERLHLPSLVESVHRNGEYNDYGWITELEEQHGQDGNPVERTIFVLQDVWDAIQEMPADETWMSRVERYRTASGVTPDIEPDLLKVIRFADQCRINLNSGLAYQGSQSWEPARYSQFAGLVQRQAERMEREDLDYRNRNADN